MATDPCRQLFEDQVQTHAFIFLDDYRRSKARTPGRKKNILRRTRAATTAALKVGNTTLLSLDCDTSAKDVQLQMDRRIGSVDDPITASIEPELQAAIPLQHYSENPTSDSSTPFPTSERGTELSVIAEGDESPERTHAVTLPSFSALTFSQEELRDTVPRSWDPSSDEPHPISSPINSDDPIPLNFPCAAQSSEADNHTEPLPSRPAINSPKDRERNAFTAPLPAPTHKNGVAGFPMLPAPSPLRKSMRMVQEALISSTLPTPALAPVPLGKRTSWLMKARGAKATEGMSSIPGTSAAVTPTAFPRVSTAVKRKSGEMLGALAEPDWDREQRKPKVAKSTDVGIVPLITQETEKIGQLGLPSVQGESIASSSIVAVTSVDHLESHTMDVDEQTTRLNSAGEGFINLFKRTVEGLGALARAATEAKVAERNKVNSESSDPEILGGDGLPDQELNMTRTHSDEQVSYVPAPGAEGAERRLSLSDLTPDTVRPSEPELSTRMSRAMDVGTRINNRINNCDKSVSTTPPESPPLKGSSGFVKPAGPVFNKPPPPVFMPPGSKQFSITSGHPQGIFIPPPSEPIYATGRCVPGNIADGLTALTIRHFLRANRDNRDGPTWVSSAQDIQYTIDSEPRDAQCTSTVADDDDDSWPLEGKLAAAEPGWRPFDFSNQKRMVIVATLSNDVDVEVETNGEEAEQEQETVELSDDERSIAEASELEEGAVAEMSGLRRVEQHADKKTQCLKDMEARRQTAIAKKAEAEKARLLEEERKSKEEVEKRKREREENTDRRPNEGSHRRQKKPESKKPSSKDREDLVPATKLATQKGARTTTTGVVSSTAYNATQNALPAPSAKPVMPEAKPFKVVPSSLKKAKAKPQEDDTGDKLPSTMVQSQMADRAKAQTQAAKLPTPEVPSESIELPEIK
ncbi:hypothetical protein L210DRAFT_3642939 [Boletus edulis BED1]|uniref:Inner centromere protein ARK-binding domain-containing protein n=1 Tax=Boletus edulis BED1 TaxID=1328754 RepID=A0AAD4BZV1_BOLED|nr:hypothetical protein L210DRAFT_3642939 [Boletus edulis BED1]